MPAENPLIFTAPLEDAAQAGATLTVDLPALQANWRMLAAQSAPAHCAATIKGDAYGLGIEPCARALWSAGCRTFFVGLPQEGIALRSLLPEAVIYVLDGLLCGMAATYASYALRPALLSYEEAAEWAGFCATSGTRFPAAVHIDTGINRQGMMRGDIDRLSGDPGLIEKLRLTLIISHLACADVPDDPMNAFQRSQFDELRAKLPTTPASLANSPGSFLGKDYHYDMIRPGVVLYGGNPLPGRPSPCLPVTELRARILQVREIAVGETVGYNATWRAERASRLAIAGAGYRDGYPRALSYPATNGPAMVALAGGLAPVVGRVSMDLVTIDVTDIPAREAQRGSEVELLGKTVSLEDVAGWAGTIPYEILTGLGSRFARIYIPHES